ncbi:hypothetical protein [Nocardia asteroides]|uniref:hypothetical protein n=1 Tax=Nocardia asteroides TaxID=1824 RepID=UPI001E56B7AC|nr:hypothetical protein [Nocardia asteroides]UGT62863.1 hypothetical protein LTT61_05865 [Nocardia asteroides]
MEKEQSTGGRRALAFAVRERGAVLQTVTGGQALAREYGYASSEEDVLIAETRTSDSYLRLIERLEHGEYAALVIYGLSHLNQDAELLLQLRARCTVLVVRPRAVYRHLVAAEA